MQGASPQGTLFSRTVPSQHSAEPRPRPFATVEQPMPPHCPQAATQQAPLEDSMPGTPLLHTGAVPRLYIQYVAGQTCVFAPEEE